MAKNLSTALRNLVVMLSLAFNKLMISAEPADWQQFTYVERTKNASKKFAWLSKFPALEKWTNSRTHKKLAKHDYSVDVDVYTATADILRTELEDEGPNVYQHLPQSAKEVVDVQRNEGLFGLLNSPPTSYDGQDFFDTDHPIYPNVDGTGTSETYSNLLGTKSKSNTSWVLLDTSRTIKPLVLVERDKPEFKWNKDGTEPYFEEELCSMGVRIREGYGVTLPQLGLKSYKDLTEANFQEALTAMQEMKTDGGRLMHIKPTLLIVPPSLEAKARTLLEAQTKANGASNTYYKRVNLIVSSYFTGA